MLARALVLGCIAGLPRVAVADEPREALLYAHCRKSGGEYVGRYRGRVLLESRSLAAMGEREAALRESITHQLRYLWGDYRNDAELHASMQLALSSEAPQIEILSRKEQPYGRAFSTRYRETAARLRVEDPYTTSAIARGRIDASDPALLVEYEVRFRFAGCGRAADPPASARVLLPVNPWLAYFYIGEELHRPLRYHHERSVTNPCADDDFADLPHPYYYWYDWLPTRAGPDDAGRRFDCHDWLRPGVDYDEVEVSYAPLHRPSHDFGALRAQLGEGAIRATVLVGVTDHTVSDPQLARWRDRLGSANAGVLAARARAALRASRDARIENGTRSFLDVLAALDEVMEVSSHRSELEDGYLLVEVRGHLKQSGREVRLRLWLGLTDVLGPVPPRHFSILRRAIVEDEVVVYWGHSGIGENFRLQQIEKHTGIAHAQMSAELARSPLRLVAFLSCYSYMYFGRDLVAEGAARPGSTYFVFTGMEQAAHEAGPLGVIDLVDAALSPAGVPARLPRLSDDEFWLITEATKAP